MFASSAACFDVGAQGYPTRPVRVVVGTAAGSNTDFFFRAVAPGMSAVLGQNLVPDYRPGAGGIVGAAAVAKSSPDGYAISMLSSGFVIQPAFVAPMPYDPLRDFTPLGLVVDVPQALVVHPSVPARSVKELVALARARPGQLNCGNSGTGTNNFLGGVLFKQIARLDIVLVPYKSSPILMVDLLSGQIEMTFPSISGIVGHVAAGRLRMLAQTGRARSATAPDVPTMQEAGLKEFSLNSRFGFAGPAQMPQAVVERFNAALVKAVQDAATRKVLIAAGADPVGSTPEEHGSFNRAEIPRWLAVVKAAGIVQEKM